MAKLQFALIRHGFVGMVYAFMVQLFSTHVFQMLAHPPGGSFDIEDSKLPIKNTPKGSNPSEEVPLLTQEPETIDQDPPKDGKLKLKQILQPLSLNLHHHRNYPIFETIDLTPDAPLYFTDNCLILGNVYGNVHGKYPASGPKLRLELLKNLYDLLQIVESFSFFMEPSNYLKNLSRILLRQI
ncbi:hypothetical protein L6452_46481 [Arctium lappa]|nr:hypothetical protein L6452_46481 [Arctium lappa]